MADPPTALFAMSRRHLPLLFPADAMRRMKEQVDIEPGVVAECFTEPAIQRRLVAAEILITGWGCPPIDESVLEQAPRLRAILHAAGSVKGHITPACWERGVIVSSAAAANALPVAEFTLAAVLFGGKDVLRHRDHYQRRRTFPVAQIMSDGGNFRRRVGIIGASHVGRRVLQVLQPFDFQVSLSDPYVTQPPPGVRLRELDNLIEHSDVVSLHAPETAETRLLLDKRRLGLIPDGGLLINTARGSLIDTDALTAELASGRISAVLDVTEPEPLPAGSPLFDLPNVMLTPHIAGSHGNEVARLGWFVLDELERLCAGTPLGHEVRQEDLERVA